MARAIVRLILALVAFGASGAAGVADDDEVQVTSVTDRLYRVDGKGIYLLSSGCFVTAYSRPARISRSRIEFAFSSCLVDAVYVAVDLRPGTYDVVATKESDNFYDVGRGAFAVTNWCYARARDTKAVLEWRYDDSGRLTFKGDSERTCNVEAIVKEDRGW